MNLKLLIVSCLILMISISKSQSQNNFEYQIEELIKHKNIVNYFADQDIIVILSNQNCNTEICNPDNISTIKVFKIFSMEDAFVRGVKAISIEEIVIVNSNITRFKLRTATQDFFTINLKTE